MYSTLCYKEINLSKRKINLAKQENHRHTNTKSIEKTYYMNQNKTIDFTSAQQKVKQRRKVELLPKTLNQENYILSLINKQTDVVVVSGPAGTGKTYLAMISAIKELQQGNINHIILTRPAVSVDDEKHGFLPGDLTSKMEPWTRPLLDVLKEYYAQTEIKAMLDEQIIEIAPLAFCRGRNFKNCWIILDEAQNATPSQLKMILTRIGLGSKLIITGDIEQTDRRTNQNGLLDLLYKLKTYSVPKLDVIEFTTKDVQRHPIIEHVLRLYS